MRTRNLCAGVMMMGMSFIAVSCSKQDQEEFLPQNKANNATTQNLNPTNSVTTWKRIETPAFSMEVPSDWVLTEMAGMDSYSGITTDRKDSMH
ncbi:MAG: hypothetical protein EOO94_04745, partial [Pedobacter sp.]